ncbi:MAG: hypothetical protein OS130_01965 [Thermodesulfobacteriota bacterium]|jgi:hypothetical protein|nr:MAG: hypothetical protein OS130_01965 [Thermodesulfobacteriota bacterium]
MKLNNETIEKFQRIYFEEFGERISKEQAQEKFLRLANFLRVIIQFPAKKLEPKSSQSSGLTKPLQMVE